MNAWHRLARVTGRSLVALFSWMTAAYALVTSSAFAYQQFIRPRVFASIGTFADWHAVLFWPWLALLAAVLAGDLARKGVPRRLSAAFLVVVTLAGLWNTMTPVLPSLTDGPRSLAVGILALLPILWIALLDHVRSWRWLRSQAFPASENELRLLESRLFTALAGAAVILTGLYAVFTSFAIAGHFEPDLRLVGLSAGALSSGVHHLVIASGAFLVVALAGRATSGAFLAQYAIVCAVLTGVFFLAFTHFIGDAIGLAGRSGTLAAAVVAASIAGQWAGLRVRGLSSENARIGWGIEVFLGPRGRHVASSKRFLQLAVLGALAWLAAAAARRLDWDFLFLKSGVVAVWLATLCCVYQALPGWRILRTHVIGAAAAVTLVAHLGVGFFVGDLHALERYAVYNPSFRVATDVLGSRSPAPSFDRYLQANAGFTGIDVRPVSIDLVHGLAPASEPRPHIFLLVIDSLRPDYLSPYNSRVNFTPRLTEFAGESLVFRNAFTRFGGTGLSMPAIWAGSAILHKQYVQPFGPMNTLSKLLDVNEYVRLIGLDHITEQIVPPSPLTIELDHGRPEMQFDFCRTLDEMVHQFDTVESGRPVFAHTRSLNLHVAMVRSGSVPSGESYPGFHAPYASRVRRIDRCFGEFIDDLRKRGVYDRSLIIFTSDHGELLGEDGQWGHSYHMIPEVIQIPLFVHLPRTKRGIRPDLEAVALSTDITPTVYDVLGYTLEPSDGLVGRSLLGEVDAAGARRADHVLAASYGAVFAALRRNGRALYIANAICGEDTAMVRTPEGRWAETEVSDDLRSANQFVIRQHVDAVRRRYGLTVGR